MWAWDGPPAGQQSAPKKQTTDQSAARPGRRMQQCPAVRLMRTSSDPPPNRRRNPNTAAEQIGPRVKNVCTHGLTSALSGPTFSRGLSVTTSRPHRTAHGSGKLDSVGRWACGAAAAPPGPCIVALAMFRACWGGQPEESFPPVSTRRSAQGMEMRRNLRMEPGPERGRGQYLRHGRTFRGGHPEKGRIIPHHFTLSTALCPLLPGRSRGCAACARRPVPPLTRHTCMLCWSCLMRLIRSLSACCSS